jgi:hypothetical protein
MAGVVMAAPGRRREIARAYRDGAPVATLLPRSHPCPATCFPVIRAPGSAGVFDAPHAEQLVRGVRRPAARASHDVVRVRRRSRRSWPAIVHCAGRPLSWKRSCGKPAPGVGDCRAQAGQRGHVHERPGGSWVLRAAADVVEAQVSRSREASVSWCLRTAAERVVGELPGRGQEANARTRSRS